MKKIFLFLIALTITFLSSAPLYANTYSLDDIGMSIDIDESLYEDVININEPISEYSLSVFGAAGISEEDLIDSLSSQNIIIDAYKFSPFYIEHTIAIHEDDYSKSVFNLSDFSDDELAEYVNELRNSNLSGLKNFASSELTIEHMQFQNINNIKMVVLDFIIENQNLPTYYCQTYLTIYNGKYIAINFNAYNKEDLASFNSEIKDTITSIKFYKEDINPNLISGLGIKVLAAVISGGIIGLIAVAIGHSKNKNKS